jgi:hypothetical protein
MIQTKQLFLMLLQHTLIRIIVLAVNLCIATVTTAQCAKTGMAMQLAKKIIDKD